MTTIAFQNSSSLPIILETWQTLRPGLSSLVSQVVACGEIVIMESGTDEYYLTNYFPYDTNHFRTWQELGYVPGFRVGKFGKLQWEKDPYICIDHNDFQIIYNSSTNTMILHNHRDK